jgi:rubredoxin
MTVEEQRRERMVCERCEAPYYAEDDPDEGIEANTEGWICEVSRRLICPDCQSLDDRSDFVRRRTEMWAQTTERAKQQMDPDMRERIEFAVREETEEIARLQREIEDLNRSLEPPAEPTGGE